MKKLLIIGAGGHGKVVADTAWETKLWEDVCFLDDVTAIINIPGKILGNVSQLPKFVKEYAVVVAVGNNRRREQLLLWARELGCVVGTVIHPQSFISKHADIDKGVVVFAHASINAFSKIGFGCIVNTAAVVEHDCVLDSCVHISPHAALAGCVKIGKYSWVGIGSNIIENISVGMNTIIGAGSVVINDIPSDSIVVGNPAKVIKKNEQ